MKVVSEKIKQRIIKTLLVIAVILMVMIFPGFLILPFIIKSQTVCFTIFNTVFVLFFLDGVLVMVLTPILGGIKSKPVKAEKIPLPLQTFEEFSAFFASALEGKGYVKQQTLPIAEEETVTLYIKSGGLWVLNCVAVIRVADLTEENLEQANEKITEILTAYYHGKVITDTVNMLSVFCVDRITPVFQKLVNSNVQQGVKNGRLTVGISFGGKSIYIAKQSDGFAIAKHKRLRKEFLTLMKLN